MSTTTTSPPMGRPQPQRWTGEDFDRASETGLFDGRRIELIDGELLEMSPMNDPHAYAVQLGTYLLIRLFPPEWFTVRVQLPLRLGDSRPQPDFAIISGPPATVSRHPTTALLIIEVSDTTLEFDEVDKARLYATNNIPEYWIVDLNARRIEVRRKPIITDDGVGRYANPIIAFPGETLSPLAAPDLLIQVADLLPPAAGSVP